MNDPVNRSYSRRFADPRTRPSNERADPFVEATRRSIANLATFIDDLEAEHDGEAVREAWRILHPPQMRARRGETGE